MVVLSLSLDRCSWVVGQPRPHHPCPCVPPGSCGSMSGSLKARKTRSLLQPSHFPFHFLPLSVKYLSLYLGTVHFTFLITSYRGSVCLFCRFFDVGPSLRQRHRLGPVRTACQPTLTSWCRCRRAGESRESTGVAERRRLRDPPVGYKRQIHLSIEDKYICQLKTNTFCNLRQI